MRNPLNSQTNAIITMILEHSKDPVSASWNPDKNTWDIGEKTKYRWITNENEAKSDWFYDISSALDWIIEYDKNKCVTV
jgi:hypothetical protein